MVEARSTTTPSRRRSSTDEAATPDRRVVRRHDRRSRESTLRADRPAQSAARRLHRRRRATVTDAAMKSARARSPACPSRSRTCSTSRACRRAPARRSTATLPPATADATLVARLEAAGAVLLGALNMGEYAYDFTGENAHDGPSRNPHDLDRMSGGSSGGSGTAVAAGLVPLALGSDTNGSIRVPASFCGLFGLKPTFGRLCRATAPSRSSPASTISARWRARRRDLALSYDAMQGPDDADPVQAAAAGGADFAHARRRHRRASASPSPTAISPARAPRAAAVAHVAAALGATASVDLPDAAVGARRGLPHHHGRGRGAAPRPAAHPRRTISTPTRATACSPAPCCRRAGSSRAQKLRARLPRPVLPLFERCRRHPRAGDADPGARHRPEDRAHRRRRAAGPAQHRHLHPADLVHRPAGRRGAGLAPRRRRCRSACR